MDKSENIKEFCIKTYTDTYTQTYKDLEDKAKSNNSTGSISQGKREDIEKSAQKNAIKVSIIKAMRKFPDKISTVWHSIYEAHIYRKSGISDFSVIQNVISADQSWKKSSGHAFEEMVKEVATLAMGDANIQFILQRDLNTLIKAGELDNEPRDISWLKEQINANIFDLYVVVSTHGKKYCFGCVQCKTSIRDRVTRDREPSIDAMESYFWSIVFVLDSDYLKNPKFQHMVSGGSQEFPTNGWHGLYDISAQHHADRIYPLDLDFKILRKHSEKAVKDWLSQRQWFNKDWKAE